MSGHSHFSTIKHKKAIEDEKRGKIFSKLARMISVVAKEGQDPEMNPKLRQALDEAKKLNMPKENVERAIKKGAGGTGEENLEEVVYEAFGPDNIAFIIEGITDNKNRTLGEIKQILNHNNGKLASEGSVKWMFGKKGVIAVSNEEQAMNIEQLELIAIEAGAEDIYWYQEEKILDIYTTPENLEKVKKNLKDKGIKIESASLDWVAKDFIEAGEKEKKTAQKLFEQLDGSEAVQKIYSNLRV
ncbi:YebC/PmpR family DNA-binding transcriptional regulator [Patescibacteria group bacterium]|nr:YebC/PmpR family DNA-binding transcriptional regulator [Patescibacteria group bacterium]